MKGQPKHQINYEASMRWLAGQIMQWLQKLYGDDMGFMLLTFRLGEDDGIANYISNGDKEVMIKFMRSTIKKFEANEVIPAVVGRVN